MDGNTEYIAEVMTPQNIVEHIKNDVDNANIILKPTKLGPIVQLLLKYQRKIVGFPPEFYNWPNFKSEASDYDMKQFKNGVNFLNDTEIFAELVQKIGFAQVDVNVLVSKAENEKENDFKSKKKKKAEPKPLYALLSNIINLDIFQTNTIPGIRQQVINLADKAKLDMDTIKQELEEKEAIRNRLNNDLDRMNYLGAETENSMLETQITESEKRIIDLKQSIDQNKLQIQQEQKKIDARNEEMKILEADTVMYQDILTIDPSTEQEKIKKVQQELEAVKAENLNLSQQLAQMTDFKNEVTEEYSTVYKAQETMMDLFNRIQDKVQITEYEKRVNALEDEIERLSQEKAQIAQQKAESDATIEELSKKYKEVMNKIKTKKRDHNRAMNDISIQFQKLRDDIDDYNKKLFSEFDDFNNNDKN